MTGIEDDVMVLAREVLAKMQHPAATDETRILAIATAIMQDRAGRDSPASRPSARPNWPPQAGELIDGLDPAQL